MSYISTRIPSGGYTVLRPVPFTENTNDYGSNYHRYRIDCKIKGFAQSIKFVYATCVVEANALAKSDPSIERILAIYRA